MSTYLTISDVSLALDSLCSKSVDVARVKVTAASLKCSVRGYGLKSIVIVAIDVGYPWPQLGQQIHRLRGHIPLRVAGGQSVTDDTEIPDSRKHSRATYRKMFC